MRWHDLILKVKPSDHEKGSGLLMVMFASGLVAAIVATTTTMMHNQTKERILDSRKAQRLAAYEFVKASLADPAALRVSAGTNSNLTSCIGAPRGYYRRGRWRTLRRLCDGGTSGRQPRMTAFQLLVPFSRNLQNIAISGLSDGDRQGRYDHRGRLGTGAICDSFSEKCPYHVRTWYWAQCPNNDRRCAKAVRIFLVAQIKQRTAVREGSQNFRFPNENNMERPTQPYKEAVFALTSDISDSIYMTCPTGSTLVGTSLVNTPGGGPNTPPLNLAKCECEQGYKVTGYDPATRWPRCAMQTCNASRGEVLSEINANGDIVCQRPNADDYVCTSQSTPSTGAVSCPDGWKMRGLSQGNDCLIENIPGIGEHVTCDAMEINCCRKI